MPTKWQVLNEELLYPVFFPPFPIKIPGLDEAAVALFPLLSSLPRESTYFLWALRNPSLFRVLMWVCIFVEMYAALAVGLACFGGKEGALHTYIVHTFAFKRRRMRLPNFLWLSFFLKDGEGGATQKRGRRNWTFCVFVRWAHWMYYLVCRYTHHRPMNAAEKSDRKQF